MSLAKYILKRILALIPIMLGVMALTFVLTRLMPGDPFLTQIRHGSESELQVYYEQRARLHLDDPLYVQFYYFFVNIFKGDWGVSLVYSKGAPVWDLVWHVFPRTLEIAFLSVFFASIIGIRVGVISAVHRNSWQDTTIRLMALVGVAVPVFWLGLLLQYLFHTFLPGFPTIGYKNILLGDPKFITGSRLIDSLITGNWLIFFDTSIHYILPVFCLTFITLASITRQTRSSMLEVLQLDYIRTARAKGAKEKDIINKHALRNALIPTITVIGMNFGALLGGAVLTETTFNLNGMGMLLIQAIRSVDYNLIVAMVFLITLLFIIVNLITDIVYGIIDPRIRF